MSSALRLLALLGSVLTLLVSSGSAQVTVCPGGGWTTGTTHTAGTGTNRLLVVAIGGESNAQGSNDFASVSYGGQALTLAGSVETSALGNSYVTSLWYLGETGVQAATDSLISFTIAGALSDVQVAAVTYCSVDQVNPIGSLITNQSSGGTTLDPIQASISIDAMHAGVAAAGCGDPGSFLWTLDLAETTDQAAASSTLSTADMPNFASSSARSASADYSGVVNYNTLIFAEIQDVPPPVAGFIGSPTTGISPLTVSFTDQSTGVVTSGMWDFGDGNTNNTEQNPSNTYASAGVYTVSLTVGGPGGSDTFTRVNYITVNEPPPIASFTGTPTTGNFPLAVTFTDTSTGGPITGWSWDFGDGAMASVQNPGHTYTAAGTYTVTMTASGPGGSDTATLVDYITVVTPPPSAGFSATPQAGAHPLAVSFTDLSTGSITNWAWDFGDSGTSTLQNPSNTYTAAGAYTVSLTVTGPGGSDTSTQSGYIVVTEPPPVAAFSGTPTSGIVPLTVNFSDSSTGGPVTSWSWTFGDGGTSTLQNPSYTYTLPGIYTVSMTVTGPGGTDTATQIDYVAVNDLPPIASFTGAPTAGGTPLTVNFSDTSAGGPITSWSWTFGDGGSSTAQNPTYTYALSGSYTVSLLVTGPGGSDNATQVDYVVVTDIPPTAGFSGTPTTGTAPLSVAFTDLSTGTLTGWSWNFGDTNTSTAQNPTHTYANAGTYTVSLTASGPAGSDTATQVGYIVVTDAPPVANFTGTPQGGNAPLTVAFTDLSAGSITTRAWDFGDTGTSSAQNPSHTYNASGNYTVSLTVTGPGGMDALTQVDYVIVGNAPPVANFIGAPTSGATPLTVNFTDQSSGFVSSWAWDFGDLGTSTLQNPTHTYTAVGLYTVSLTVTGPGGTDTVTRVDYVSANEPPPIAGFTGTPTTGNYPLTVAFTDTSTGGPVTNWSWNFGDGGTSSVQNPGHTYVAAGTYTVALTVTGPGGVDTATVVDYITVNDPPPVANFTGAPTTGDNPLTVSFTDSSTGGPVTSWAWDFGDLGTATVQDPTHTYSAAGTYTVALTVTGPGGTDTLTRVNYIVVVEPAPVANFTGTPLSGDAPLLVAFTDLSTGPITTWAWDFGDGGTSTAQNPSNTYAASGGYTVSLTVTGPGGTDTLTQANFVVVGNSPPVANFIGSPTTGADPLTVNFTDQSSGLVTSWAWDFGDTGTSTAQSPSHTYTAVGSYTVSLTVTGPGGTDAVTRVNYIVVDDASPIASFTGAPTAGFAPLSVAFTDTSTGTITSWAWDFGDGGSSTVQNPSHTYANAGAYTVSLTVTGPGGSNTATLTDYVVVTDAPPVADFIGAPLTGAAPLTVSFTDQSTGNITSRSWDFGDTGTSTAQNPSHTYNTVGTYSVALTVTGPGGTDTRTRVNYIVVFDPAPVANFSATPQGGNAPLLVAFTDLSSGPVTAWAWDFGDGGSSTVQNPSHTYTASGNYAVSLTVTGPGGTDTLTQVDFVIVGNQPPVANFIGSPTTGARPLTVNFTDQSGGLVSSWAWDFGDTGTSTVQNPTHTYTAVGVYTVSLTVTGPGGTDTSTRVNYINVSEAAPVAGFTGTPTTGFAPLAVAFTDSSSGVITNWAWDFGDGGSSTAQNPSHTYATAGSYTVNLTVTGPGGSDTSTLTDYIVVTDAPPVADFIGSPLTGDAPLTVSFTDQSSGNITNWAWNFGDGGTSIAQNPTRSYNTVGTYTVGLTVTGPGGVDTRTRVDYIVVVDPAPVANFVGSPLGGNAPLLVSFTDLSTGPITSYAWDFGDGGTSIVQNPSHTYGASGNYTVSLTVTGPGGTDTLTLVDYIVVGNSAPIANFIGSPTAGAQPLTVNFTDQSAGIITSWAWTFGDAGTSTVQNPSHTYTAVGTYTVSLTVTGPGGTDTSTRVNYINVSDAAPVASFSGAPTSGFAPLPVAFSDTSTGVITSWAWDFGDGGSSTAQNPSHTYATAGSYTVNLTVTGPGGSDTATLTDYIVVTDAPPVADFIGSPLAGAAPLTVAFTDQSSGNITSGSWDFGDGGTATVQNPTHIYTNPGSYTVSLTVTGPGGMDTRTRVSYIVVVDPAPVANFTGSPQGGNAPLLVAFTDLSSGPITAWAWDFGDTGTSTVQNPSHTYATSGNYTVSLTVTGPGGTDTLVQTDYIVVGNAAPVANFFGTPTTGATPLTVNFTDQSSGIVSSWAWNFGDGGTSTAQNPSHTFVGVGTYTVSLTVTGPGGTDSVTRVNYINVTDAAPVASFSGAPTTGFVPLAVAFTDTSTGVITNWSWDFGDGGTAIVQNPSHTYTSAGAFTVTLTVTGPGGIDSSTRTDYVNVTDSPPVADFTGTPVSGPAPLAVAFTDASTGLITSGLWDFGDGNTLMNVQNPTHTYTSVGTYTVSLTVSGPGGTDTRTRVDYIDVFNPAPVANFLGSPLAGTAPLLVSFSDLSSGPITSWTWDFGDGGTSTVQNPSHTYGASGSYSVALTVTGPGGTDTLTRTDYVVVGNAPPVANFVGVPTSGIAPLTVSFTDQSSGLVTGWAWDFGDGGTSLAQNPTYTFAAAGTYTVSLTASGPGGTDTSTRVNYINVSEPAPIAAFSGSPTSGVLPLVVAFTDLSTGGPVTTWSWNFGDGGVSAVQNPTHTYSTPGTFTVSLTVTGPGGTDIATQFDYITVGDQTPIADFTGSPTTGVLPLTVSFTELASGGPVSSYVWSFGDGGASAAQNPTYTYNAAGTYTVSLTLTGPGGTDTATRVNYITVNEQAPIANFSGTPQSGSVPFDVIFSDLSTGGPITNWSWNFGDGGTSTVQNPVHSYTVSGVYTVSLTVTGPGGTDAATVINYIDATDPAPTAAFSGTPRNGTNPLTVAFTDLSTGPITSRLWDFGDGGTSAALNPTHTYSTDGFHTVSLTVNGPGGSDTLVEVDYIGVGDLPTANFSGSPTAGTAPLTVQFSDLSTGVVTGWLWDFGNGNTSATQAPQHTYVANGNYTVSLTAIGPGGSDTFTRVDYITVGGTAPVADFTGTPTSGAVPLTVDFTDLTAGVVTQRTWDFGDGSGTVNVQNPTHIYNLSGTYSVSLTVTGPGGTDTLTRVDYIVVGNQPPVADFIANPLNGNVPLTVDFTDRTNGMVSAWAWTFGDGGSSVAQNPTHTYNTPGLYTVSLTATGPGGTDTLTRVDYITVNDTVPVAAFSATPRNGAAPLTVAFTDNSTGTITNWLWNFGDGNTSTLQSPSNTYTIDGSYTVSLTVTGPGGTDTLTEVDYVGVGPVPTAFFTGSPRSGVSPLTVQFTDLSTGPVTGWLWDFGNGNTAISQGPQHTYTANGTYTVSLTVTGPGGSDTHTEVGFVVVGGGAPVADFTGNPTSGTVPLTVNFTDASTGNITSGLWDFGDGSTSLNVQNPMHTYTSAGTYTVSLTVSGPQGSNTRTRVDYITVSDVAPVAAFAGAPRTGSAPLTVNYTDLSAGIVNAWSWNFGDGGTSTAQNPSYTYTTPGTYSVSLTASGPGGSDTLTQIDYVFVADPVPVASFTGTPTNGTAPLTVAFTDTSTGSVTNWLWNFGDGGTSTAQNPSNTYGSDGTYTVSLTVTGPGGTDTLTQVDYIGVGDPVTAAFTGTPTSGPVPLTVIFSNQSTGTITSYLWDFGDGGTGNSAAPQHTYSAIGTYTVSLTVSGPGGSDTLTLVDYVRVTDTVPVASFTGTPTSGLAPLAVAFTDTSDGLITSWAWNFGDGNTSSQRNPTHTYTTAGTYDVTLSVTGPTGADSVTQVGYITVADGPPVAGFVGTPTSGLAPLTVQFNDQSTGVINSGLWDFGDGNTLANVQNPSHTYANPGTYSVSLMVSGPGGSDTLVRTDYIVVNAPPPVASFTGTPRSGSAPLSVSFTDTTTGAVTGWSWTFGDGGTSTAQNPSYTYAANGNYTVSLTATGPGGTDTHTEIDYIAVGGVTPVADFVGTPQSGTAPLTVRFGDLSTGNVTGWLWDFGDGSTSTTQSPQHTYTTNGTYDVSLTVSGPNGSDTLLRTAYVFVGNALPLGDGSFENQTPGTLPVGPWLLTQGFQHVINPVTVASDNGMPTRGSNWAEVSAAGTNAATPPSNPGGAGTAPIGAGGISQTFAITPGRTTVYFNAAFITGEAPNSLATNDFMSVDVTDGVTTYNLYHADTFSSFPNTSAKYGAPMTDVTTVAADLQVLYPTATPSTIFTILVQVGNGGNSINASAGYVDQIGLGINASAIPRNGSGINVVCLTSTSLPELGTTWRTQISHIHHPGTSFTLLLVRAAPTQGIFSAYGEVLVTGGKYLRNTVSTPGMVDLHNLAIPLDLMFLGVPASVQGVIFGGAAPELCNALDITVGF